MAYIGDYTWVGVGNCGWVGAIEENWGTIVEEANVAPTELKDVVNGEAGVERYDTDLGRGEGLEDVAGAGPGGGATTVVDVEVAKQGCATVVFGQVDASV